MLLALVSVVSLRFTVFQAPTPNAVTSRSIINNMLASIDKIPTFQFTLKSWERVDGKDKYSEVDAKLNVKPFKLYLNSKAEPNDGVQILYNEAEYGTKALVNPGSWLPNVKLDPYGSKMRKGQHHTIMNSGFTFLASIIRAAITKADKEAAGEFEKHFVYEGDVVWNGRKCYKLVIDDPTFKYENHTVKAGETVESIAKSKKICGFLILEKVIKIPSTYAKKTILYIDQQYNLPIVQIMHDEVGQFERYEFHNLVPNAKFSDGTFKGFP